MKAQLRIALIASAIYTALVSYFLWAAFFGRVPNDAGTFVFFSSLPTSLLADATQFWRLREPVAVLLHQPVTDRVAMSLDASVGWLMGCIQYSLIAIACVRLWRFTRRRRAPTAS
jgi:hypothetical protein